MVNLSLTWDFVSISFVKPPIRIPYWAEVEGFAKVSKGCIDVSTTRPVRKTLTASGHIR